MLLVTAPTVRAGLLSWRAWQILAGAVRVLAPSADHPLLPALDEAGIAWEVLAGSGGAAPPALAGHAVAVSIGRAGRSSATYRRARNSRRVLTPSLR